MNQDDYQKIMEEHRQSTGIEEDRAASRLSRRASYSKKTKKKSKSIMIPTLFFIFILIPTCIFIYVQFFYSVKEEVVEVTKPSVIQVETQSFTKEKDKEKVEVESTEKEKVEQKPPTVIPDEKQKEEPKVEEPKKEEKPIATDKTNTHQVQKGETLYRIAMNYYNNPEAVDKIKAANGLTSNEISVGQNLILP